MAALSSIEVPNLQAPLEADQATIDSTHHPAESPLNEKDDHMSTLIEAIRAQDREIVSTPNPKRRRSNKTEPASASKKTRRKSSITTSSPKSLAKTSRTTFKRPLDITVQSFSPPPSMALSSTSATTPLRARKPKRHPFPLLTLPPELRNKVYAHLLTYPQPIELPRTAREAAARRAAWEECKSKRARRAFKTIFLEILCTSHQVHAEATGILYGSNIFKFRSDHKDGPKPVPLPAKYLPLLRHVKVSVISREQEKGQDKWVAGLLGAFEGARLERFELTWYGWKRYRLLKDGVLCQALLRLKIENVFAVKVLGEARMKTAMLKELEGECGAKNVEIQRPLITVMREGGRVEVSDEDEE